NHISPEMLQGAPRFAEVAEKIQEMLVGAIGVAHNATFDLGFLKTEFLYLHRQLLVPPCLDTLAMARSFYSFPKNNLGVVANALACEVETAPRARPDVQPMRLVFDAMTMNLSCQGLLSPKQIQDQLKRARRKKRKKSKDAPPEPPAPILMSPPQAAPAP